MGKTFGCKHGKVPPIERKDTRNAVALSKSYDGSVRKANTGVFISVDKLERPIEIFFPQRRVRHMARCYTFIELADDTASHPPRCKIIEFSEHRRRDEEAAVVGTHVLVIGI